MVETLVSIFLDSGHSSLLVSVIGAHVLIVDSSNWFGWKCVARPAFHWLHQIMFVWHIIMMVVNMP